jgi:head-tail adaptor
MIIGNKPTNPGELRTTVSLLSPTVPDGTGGFNPPAYAVAATVKVKWTNVHGSDEWAAEAVQAIQPATVLMRYYAALKPTWRVRKGSLDYEIVGGVDNIQERGEWMEFKVRLAANG